MRLNIKIVGVEEIDCAELFHSHGIVGEITEDEFIDMLCNGGILHCCSDRNGGAALAINTDKVICFVDGTLYMSK